MTAKPTQIVILFTDICGSTRLYERLGNVKGQRLVDRCLAAMTEAIESTGGQLIKTIGDEAMAVFPLVDQALQAALLINERIDAIPLIDADAPHDLAVRTGFHCGEAIWDKGDVYGDAVNVAARLSSLAKAHQVLTSGQSVGALTMSGDYETRMLESTVVKGRSEPVDLYEIVRHCEEMTRMSWDSSSRALLGSLQKPLSNRLRLTYGDQQYYLTMSDSPLTLGRGEQAMLVVQNQLASRAHAQIEPRGKGFYYIDHSTNGTYLLFGATTQFLRRQSVELLDRGFLLLGASPEEATDDDRIAYSVETGVG